MKNKIKDKDFKASRTLRENFCLFSKRTIQKDREVFFNKTEKDTEITTNMWQSESLNFLHDMEVKGIIVCDDIEDNEKRKEFYSKSVITPTLNSMIMNQIPLSVMKCSECGKNIAECLMGERKILYSEYPEKLPMPIKYYLYEMNISGQKQDTFYFDLCTETYFGQNIWICLIGNFYFPKL
jgi:hypothetical protein